MKINLYQVRIFGTSSANSPPNELRENLFIRSTLETNLNVSSYEIHVNMEQSFIIGNTIKDISGVGSVIKLFLTLFLLMKC